jgi:hypothetical protein
MEVEEQEQEQGQDREQSLQQREQQREQQGEQDHWHTVLRTFLHYHDFVGMDRGRRQSRINNLPARYAARLPQVRVCVL